MKKISFFLSVLFLTACSSNNNSSSGGGTPIVPVPAPVISSFSLKNISDNAEANSSISFDISVNKTDGSVDSSFSGNVMTEFFSDSKCSVSVTVNGTNGLELSSTANKGIASFSSVYFNSAGEFFAKISDSAGTTDCSQKITIQSQHRDLHINSPAMFAGTFGKTILTFSQSSTEKKAVSLNIFMDKNSDSNISYIMDDSSIVSDDGTIRKYSFNFTDYMAQMQTDGSKVFVQIFSDGDSVQSSDLTDVVISAPSAIASEGSDNTLMMEVKAPTSSSYSAIAIFTQADFGKTGASPIYTINQAQMGPDNETLYFLGQTSDMYRAYKPGTILHFEALTQNGNTVDLGQVTVGDY